MDSLKPFGLRRVPPGLKGLLPLPGHSPHGLQHSEATFLCLSCF